MRGRQRWQVVGTVLLVALAVRVLWALLAQVTPVSDFAGYDAIARRWLATGQYRDDLGLAYRTPAYPALLAGTYALCGTSLKALGVVQAVLGALTAAGVALLASQIVSARSSLLAGLIQALAPTAIVYVPILASENLAAFLSISVVLCLAAAQATVAPGRRSLVALMVGGVAAGLLLLTRPATLFIAPAWLVLAAYSFPRRTWRVRGAIVFILFLAATLTPWLVRNARLGLGPLALSTQGGIGLWWGNNPQERSGTGDGVQGFVPDPALSERQRDLYYRSLASRWVRENPTRYLQLCRARLIRMLGNEPDWVAARYLIPTAANDRAMKALAQMQEGRTAASPELATQARTVQSRNLRLLRALRIVVAPLICLAFVLSLARLRSYALVNLPFVCYAVGLVLTIFDPRYRAVSDPLLAILLAALLSDVALGTHELCRWPSRRAKLIVAALAVAASILVHAADVDRNWYRLPASSSAHAGRAIQRDVQRAARKQLGVRAGIHDPAFVHDHDPLGHVHHGVPMRDQKGRLAAAQLVERGVDLPLALRVHLAGRLVEDQDRGRLEEGPRDGNPLPLPAAD
jgi:hypothetical protein